MCWLIQISKNIIFNENDWKFQLPYQGAMKTKIFYTFSVGKWVFMVAIRI